jgi:hypothetical protein
LSKIYLKEQVHFSKKFFVWCFRINQKKKKHSEKKEKKTHSKYQNSTINDKTVVENKQFLPETNVGNEYFERQTNVGQREAVANAETTASSQIGICKRTNTIGCQTFLSQRTLIVKIAWITTRRRLYCFVW